MARTFAAILAALVAAAVSLNPATAQTRERIVDFHSEIWVHADASMTVVETITVDSAQIKIKRGIFRDFPTEYKRPSGDRVVVGFKVQEVLRGTRREPYRTERRSNGVRVYIGDADVFIPAGRHVYRITYKTNRQLGFFDAVDELFWNVTGNGWDFTIEQARATVHLPDGAGVLNHAGYTGYFGSRGQDYEYSRLDDQTVSFKATRPLGPRQGLSISLTWPRGYVERPTNAKMLAYWVGDNLPIVIAILGPLLLLVYFLVVWAKFGRDPEKGSIFPRYEPPKGLSPAGARFILGMGFDEKAFTAAIVNMAVKGFLTIEESLDETFTLRLTGQSADLSRGESAIVDDLFPDGCTEIELDQENRTALLMAKITLQGALGKEFESLYFIRNERLFLPGFAFTILVPILMIASDVTVLNFDDAAKSFGAVASFGLMVVLNILFYRLLKAPTRLGRRVMDEIEGFKDYLSIAEKDRMNFANPPDKTPQLFERFLPYALALGVEQQWAEQFSAVLSRAARDAPDSDGDYSPNWYSGRRFNSGFADCASSLSGGFTSAISSASSAPGSSSGGFSSGGGFSGGGGGGGGGGGW